MKILTLFGTRPEAIKMAPVIKLLNEKHPESVTCVTAQHRQMLDQVLQLFGIYPLYDLDLMKPNQSLSELSATILTKTSDIISKVKPDCILVQGDTSSTLMSALSAFYQRIPVGHIEAGLRSFDKYAPWPEEMNRQLTTHLADHHFAPTSTNIENLLNENVNNDKIYINGNTVIDALQHITHKLEADPTLLKQFKLPVIENNKKLILVTGHRRESFGEGFKEICHAIAHIAKRNDVQIIYPVHLNPNVQKPVTEILANIENVKLIEPLDYLPFVYLMNQSYFIITDSGGIQEEAPALGKPVLVMREKTERPEAIDAGTSRLVGTNFETITTEANLLLDSIDNYNAMAKANNPYGDGHAAEKIVAILEKHYGYHHI